MVGTVNEAKFKERVQKIVQGQTLPLEELGFPISTVTSHIFLTGYPGRIRQSKRFIYVNGKRCHLQAKPRPYQAPQVLERRRAKFSFTYAGSTA